ncbi:MAG: hypothetical protein DI535_09195 [Citrobacter freundii]|nr:MAG: hypothetical protein DI535_09195 [Citrobacter freundii]
MRLLSLYDRFYLPILFAGLFVLAGCNDDKGPRVPVNDLPVQGGPIVLKGIVQQFESDDNGDVNGILIKTDNGERQLHFPPHTAKLVMATAKLLTAVELTAREMKRPHDDAPTLELVSISAADQFTDLKQLHPPPPQRGEEVSVEGKVSDVQEDKSGRIRSFIVGQTMINLPPHVDMNVAASLSNAKSIIVKGYQRAADDGFVNIKGLRVVRPISITINNRTYTVE